LSTPQEIGALRLLLGGGSLALYGIIKNPGAFTGVSVRQGLAGGVFVATYQICFFWGVSLTGIAVGTMVAIGSAPVFAGILDRLFFKRVLSARWYLSTSLALAGCLLLMVSGTVEIHLSGIMLAAGAGLSYGVYSLFMKKMLDSSPAATVAATVFCFGALLLLPFLASADLTWVMAPTGLLITIHLGLLATAVSYIFFCKGLEYIAVSKAVTLSLAEPLTAGLLGILLLDEQLGAQGWFGLFLILSGLVILAWPPRLSVPSSREGNLRG